MACPQDAELRDQRLRPYLGSPRMKRVPQNLTVSGTIFKFVWFSLADLVIFTFRKSHLVSTNRERKRTAGPYLWELRHVKTKSPNGPVQGRTEGMRAPPLYLHVITP